jgi:hypothetical protein
MERVADLIDLVLTRKDDQTVARVKADVRELTERFPLYAAPRAERRATLAHAPPHH